MKLTITFFTALIAAAAFSSTGTAHTTLGGKWATNRIGMLAHQASFPVGSSFRTALGAIEDIFLFDQPSPVYFDITYDDPSCSLTNNQNEIWFSAQEQYNPAVAFTWTSGGTITKADIVFYSAVDYTTSNAKTDIRAYGGDQRPFVTTALHEFCHVAGLGHEDDEYNIMGEDFTHVSCNGSTYEGYIGEDAANGLVSLYGLADVIGAEDVGVTLFKRTGVLQGEYSDHDKCRMYTSSGGWMSSSSFNGQRRYNVSPGSTVQAEFTFENNGASFQPGVKLGFYLSTNSFISKWDTRIATQTMNLGRNDVYTSRRTLTLPTNLTSGQTLYLGVIVDDGEHFLEMSETNNAAYHVIKVN